MNQQAEISATESLKIDANRDFVNNGSKASGKDITIDAGRNVEMCIRDRFYYVVKPPSTGRLTPVI